MFCLGSPSKKSALLELIGKVALSASRAHRVIRPILRVRGQFETREDPEQRNEYCRSIITRKIEASVMTLEKSIPVPVKWERAKKSAYAGCLRSRKIRPRRLSTCAHWRPIAPPPIFAGGSACPLNGAAQAPGLECIGPRSSPYHLGSAAKQLTGRRDIEICLCRARKRKIRIKPAMIPRSASCTRAATDRRNSFSIEWRWSETAVFDPADLSSHRWRLPA